MTLGELRDYITGMPKKYDELLLVISGHDHSYYRASGQITYAECHKGNFFEYFSKDDMQKDSKKVSVLLIS